MAFFKAKVPVALATGLICLLVGGGVGGAIMSYTLSDKAPQAAAGTPGADEEAKGEKGDAKAAGAKGGKTAPGGNKAAGGAGGKGAGGGGGGFRGPGPKTQLAQLVGKLDTLTAQSLHIDLTPEQKKQAKEVLAGLAEKEELTDDEAKAKLDSLMKLLEANKKTLEDSGYRWPGTPAPGGGGAPAPTPPPNPFKPGDGATQLQSLQSRLEK